MDFGLGEIMFAAAMSTGMTVNAAYDVFNSFGLGKYFLNPDPYGTAGGFGTPGKRKRPAQDTTPPPSAKKPRIPKGQANTGRSEAVPIGLPPSVANPRPPKKKVKQAPTMGKTKYINGDHGNITTSTDVIKVVKNPSKPNSKLAKIGRCMHVHSYGFKANATSTGYKGYYACKPSIAAENFLYTGVSAGTMLNESLIAMDPNFLQNNNQGIVGVTGLLDGITQTSRNNQAQYVRLESIMCSLHLKNMLNLPARICVYWLVPKQNTRIGPVQKLSQQFQALDNNPRVPAITIRANNTPGTVGVDFGEYEKGAPGVGMGQSYSGGYSNTQMYTPKGYNPTDFPEWNKCWKIIKKDYVNLPSGTLVVHSTKLKYGKLFSEQYYKKLVEEYPAQTPGDNTSDNPLFIKNLSIVPLISVEGFVSQADVGTAANQVTFGSFDVNVGWECKSKSTWVENTSVQPMSTFRSDVLFGAPQTSEEFINIVDADAVGDPAD